MKTKKIVNSIVRLLLACASMTFACMAQAQSIAGVGAQFLQLSPSPRAAALGDAYVSQSGSADTLYYNPAASIYNQDTCFSASYTRWIGGMNYFSIFGSHSLSSSLALGAGSIGFSLGGIPETTYSGLGGVSLTGNEIATSDLSGIVNGSWIFLPGLSTGVNMKFISQALSTARSFSFASDLGLFYGVKNAVVRVGLVVQNLGTSAKFFSDEAALPLSMKLGGSYDFRLDKNNNILRSILMTAQVRKTFGESLSISGGLEALLWNILMLRGGYAYQANSDSSGLSTGIGFNYDHLPLNDKATKLQFNYSLGFFKDLGLTHSFQINMTFLSVQGSTADQEIQKNDSPPIAISANEESIAKYKRTLADDPKSLRSAYNLACVYSLIKDIKSSSYWVGYLSKLDHSFSMKKKLESDSDLENLRMSTGYPRLMKKFDSQ